MHLSFQRNSHACSWRSPSTGTINYIRAAKIRSSITLVVVLLAAAHPCIAEPLSHERRTLSTEFSAEKSNMPPGGMRFERRWFLFPVGCEYVSHTIEVIEEVPERGPTDHPSISDRVRKYSSDRARTFTADLSVMIAAYRPTSLPPGPTSLKVRVSVVVECEESAWSKLKETFGVEKYP